MTRSPRDESLSRTPPENNAEPSAATGPPDPDEDPIEEARRYGIDISLIHHLLGLSVAERLRRNDADAAFDRALREARRRSLE